MRYFLLIGVLLIALNSFGQTDTKRKIKETRSYQDSVLLSINKYDVKGNKIFWYRKLYVGENWNGNYVTMVGGEKYDEENHSFMRITAHSNVGFSIHYPEIKNDSTEFEYSIKDGYDENPNLSNENQFAYIRVIQSQEALFKHEQIKKMLSNGKKFCHTINIKDSRGNLIREYSLNKNRDTSLIRISRYDDKNNEIYFYYNPGFAEWEIYFDYDTKGNRLSSKRVPYKRVGDEIYKLDTTEVIFYKYDENSNLIETTRTDKGKFREKTTYRYNTKNEMIEKKSWIDEESNLVAIETYEYQNGYVVERRKVSLRKRDAKPKIIKYTYIFYEE